MEPLERLVQATTRKSTPPVGEDRVVEPPLRVLSDALSDIRALRFLRVARVSPMLPDIPGHGYADHQPGEEGPFVAVDLLMSQILRSAGVSEPILIRWHRRPRGRARTPVFVRHVHEGKLVRLQPLLLRLALPKRLQWSIEQWGSHAVLLGQSILVSTTIAQADKRARRAGGVDTPGERSLARAWGMIARAARAHSKEAARPAWLSTLLRAWLPQSSASYFYTSPMSSGVPALTDAARDLPALAFCLGLFMGAAPTNGKAAFLWSVGPGLCHELRWGAAGLPSCGVLTA